MIKTSTKDWKEETSKEALFKSEALQGRGPPGRGFNRGGGGNPQEQLYQNQQGKHQSIIAVLVEPVQNSPAGLWQPHQWKLPKLIPQKVW